MKRIIYIINIINYIMISFLPISLSLNYSIHNILIYLFTKWKIINNILFNLNFDLPFEDNKLIWLLWLTNLKFLFLARQSLGEFALFYKIFIIFIKIKPFLFVILLSKNSIFSFIQRYHHKLLLVFWIEYIYFLSCLKIYQNYFQHFQYNTCLIYINNIINIIKYLHIINEELILLLVF